MVAAAAVVGTYLSGLVGSSYVSGLYVGVLDTRVS